MEFFSVNVILFRLLFSIIKNKKVTKIKQTCETKTEINSYNSIITIVSKFNNIRIDVIHKIEIKVEMANIKAKLILQFLFEYQLTFLTIFNKYGEDDKFINQIEVPNTLKILTIQDNQR